MDMSNTPRRPQTMLNDFRYPMPKSDKPVDGNKYPARATWECGLNGNIYFKVNDGAYGKDDRNAKLKEVEMSIMDRGALFNLMENAINDPNFTRSQYCVKKQQFGGNGRMNENASTLGTFTIIRDAEGRILMGYTKGTYKVMFPFTSPFESVILVSNDGQEPREDHGLMSRVYCKAYIDFCRKFLDQYETDNFKPREKKGDSNSSQGGGSWGNKGNSNSNSGNSWNGNGGGNSGGNQTRQAPPDFDDNIDF